MEMTDQDKQVTNAYRRNGAKLSMNQADANFLVKTGCGKFDKEFDNYSLKTLGVSISGKRVDRIICGESPTLFLTGGIKISRGDVDVIVGIHPVDISGLFND